jgi:hypothetical protein
MGKWSHLVGHYPERKTALKDLKSFFGDKTTEELEELVTGYYTEYKDLQRQAVEMCNRYEACSELLVAKWSVDRINAKKRNDIGSLSRLDQVFARVTDMPVFKKWAQENGIGNLVQETVNHTSLTSAVKELIADGNPLPDGITVFTKSRIKPVTTTKT